MTIADCDTDAPLDPTVDRASGGNVSFDIYLLLVRSNEWFDKNQNVTLLEHAGLVLRRNPQGSTLGTPLPERKPALGFRDWGTFFHVVRVRDVQMERTRT
jgi:hypothetical protein